MRKKKISFFIGVLCLSLTFVIIPFSQIQAKTIKLKFANYFPTTSPYSKICETFIDDLEKRSDGRIKVQYFPGGSLAKAPVMYKSIKLGVADIGLSHVEYTPGRFPATEACGLPLSYPSGWVSTKVINDFYHEFKPKEWNDVKVMWLHASTPSVIISKKQIQSLDDLKGLIIRAPGRVGDVIKALGGTAAPTPIVETYDAISKGVIDGTNTSFELIKSFRFAEVAKYAILSWQVGTAYPFYVIMNKKSYEKLPPDVKAIFDTLCGEYSQKFALMWNRNELAALKFGIEKKMKIHELSPDQVKKWKAAAAPVVDDYVKDMVDKGFTEAEVHSWISFIKKRIDYYSKLQIASGIKSVTGPKEMRP